MPERRFRSSRNLLADIFYDRDSVISNRQTLCKESLDFGRNSTCRKTGNRNGSLSVSSKVPEEITSSHLARALSSKGNVAAWPR